MTALVSLFPAPSQTFIRRKLGGLAAAGVDVRVAATTFGPGAADSGHRLVPLAPWQSVRELAAAGRPAWGALGRALLASPDPRPGAVRRRLVPAPLDLLDSDVVHFEFSGIAVTYLDSLDALSRRARLAVSCRGAAEQIEPIKDPARGRALGEAFRRMDLIHCVSEDMRRSVEALGAPPDRIVVNRPAVPVAEFAPLRERAAREGGPLRVLSIGRLHWKKGFDDGLRAVAELGHRGVDVHHRIVGDGPEREKLAFLVDQLGLAGRVEFLGTRTTEEVRAELARCDVLLLPSLSEGISNAVLEAMAAGRAVVTTDCGGMEEVVTDDVDGLVVGVGDVAGMADRLAALAGDDALVARLGGAAAARADLDFDIGRQVDVFLDAYRRITDR